MNFPLWDIPAPGLLIAGVAIFHVFISHFAVGGGLFLVLAERKARREHDDALLAFVERHSRFFALVTLVTGALTGVGIWFTIGLINPSATASLIASFVWGWAIEWTFFVTEIAAAIVYVYGWHRLSPAVHLRVGWVYFIAAWLSLAVINGILTFMLTPGAWVATHGFWAGILNPTYLPSLVTRTAGAAVLAGVYALLTASWMANRDERARIARYAATRWVLPGAIVMPIGIAWYLGAASRAGVQVAAAFGAASRSIPAIVHAAFSAPSSGQPMAERAVMVFALASAVLIVVTAVIARWRASRYGPATAAVAMVCALLTLGAGEWIREDLRKPFILGDYMFVTGVRLPAPEGSALPSAPGGDRFALDAVEQRGVLQSALWSRPLPVTGDATVDAIARGQEISSAVLFRVPHEGRLQRGPSARPRHERRRGERVARTARASDRRLGPAGVVGDAARGHRVLARPAHAALCRHGRRAAGARRVSRVARWDDAGRHRAGRGGIVVGRARVRGALLGLPRQGRAVPLQRQGTHGRRVLRAHRPSAHGERGHAALRWHGSGAAGARRLPAEY